MSALVGEDHSVTGVGIEDKAMGHLDSYHQIDCTQRDQLAVLDFEVDRIFVFAGLTGTHTCLLYTSPSPRDQRGSRMPSSA